ncbi:ribosome biogenesis GTPase Der [Anaerotignum lactatifermentans]|uniref:GTPase Der n=1 Tax=Anaerotignum lactatifermentans TaxID=160404 RepID=A0ABS2GCB9_9FIRM|nr:ribosome biogenesis GTPase Der [Anaerotignum lactatifermentans]MBM6828621.1 ribosome biogenesis GTPase Der [Anaerotignum lactatifermentans]MBM6878507.1 ribosome biogenesis GTPase Der [Anaerotignum lactatifermentans]MBM6950203.1 ribosome biogenesis GTPase Der [Anaerotignum lactatifermentans]
MSKPIVAVVGRPNVGKSTLFNRLAGERISIVQDTPGVTRDRIYADVEWLNHKFTLIDTGGMEIGSEEIIQKQILQQAEIAIETADVILFVTDVKAGVTDDDRQVANKLRRTKKPVVLAVNKVDSVKRDTMDIYEFYELAIGDPMPISAGQALGLGDMLDEVVAHFPEESDHQEEDDAIKVAIIGKPNVGKSSLINRILGEDRLIVSNIPGTTRDAIDSPIEVDGQKYVFIDTAGMRRKSKIKEEIERFSIIRAVAAVERCDVAVLVIDANEGVTDQDTKIAGIAHERGKAAIIAVNKWDSIEKNDKTMNQYLKDIGNELAYMPYAPRVFISAQTGQRVNRLLEMIRTVNENHALRISTGVLNEVLIEATAMQQPPADKGRQLRLYYMTQVSVKPPTFVIFVNERELFHFSYRRYIENQLREAFGFMGTPIHFIVREKGDKD